MIFEIRNGLIVDGSGERPFIGSVFIENDRIIEVSKATENKVYENVETIDATNLIVAPGFIDAHSHSDAYLIIEPSAASKILQGITTEINGQCGGSIAPRFGDARLSSDWASLLGARLTWRTLGEYRDVLSSVRPAINTMQFTGHNTLRSSVVGYDARVSTKDELRLMIKLLEQSMDEGSCGLTTGLIYQPGKYATREEITTLARACALRGGLYATHMKSEGDHLLESIDEVIYLARETNIKAEISHLKTSGENNWHKLESAIEKIENAMKDGFLLGADRYPFCASGTDLDIVLPDWAQEGAAAAETIRLANPTLRAKIVDELNAQKRDWSRVMIGGVWDEENRKFSGQLISDIFKNGFGSSIGDLICKILEKDKCRTGAFFFTMSEENLDKLLRVPWVVAGSDASLRAPWGDLGKDHPHPRAYGTMCEFYRRARALQVSREEIIARMTNITAERFGIKNRGKIKNGYFADITIFDEKTFSSKATYLNPHQFASGVKYVFVNGELSVKNGELTRARGGSFIEHARA